jgi:pyrimidine-specific ribonucleoside hydrolase
MRKLFFFVLFIFVNFSTQAHSGKASCHAIIDTDGAADDLRAICMLLGNSEVEVLAVTTSEGALRPEDAALKTVSLLHHFHHEGIPAGTGRSLNITPPAWRKQSEEIFWGDTAGIRFPAIAAKELITETVRNAPEKVTFICLGPLTNISDALEASPDLSENIDRILWYRNRYQKKTAANYQADPESAEKIMKSGIKLEIISENRHPITVDRQYIDMVAETGTPYAKKIADSHRKGVLAPVLASGHLKTWDDLVVVYLFEPGIFGSDTVSASVTSHFLEDEQAAVRAKEQVTLILKGKPDGENRVFHVFPENSELYAEDVAPFVNPIIRLHGKKEWRSGVLTNELHGHLGIYAIIGVKMGIRVREYYNIGVDDIYIVTCAGSRPPVSCMNDGLQVSTGGTLGHGLITVVQETPPRPEATFTFKNKSIRMTLKPEYAGQIRADVEEGIRLYGNLTEPYWEHIRTLAIKYWLEFDRHEIFELEKLK